MSFKDVVGQDAEIAFLKAAYRQNRVAHAYVFVGPEGVGKSRVALNFTKLLFCENSKDAEACGCCASCLKVDHMNHPDLQRLSPEGQFIKIDAVREACRRLSLRSFESSQKVLIVSGAEHLNEESSNALLKTLEEPTAHTVIILITDTLKSILPTIVSRCQRIVFSMLNEQKIISMLKSREGISESESVYLARLSEGSLGKALSFHESALFTRKNTLLKNVLDRNCSLEDFIDLSSRERSDKTTKIEEALLVLSSWYRDILLTKMSHVSSLINIDRSNEASEASRLFSVAEIEGRLSAIAEASRDLGRHVNVRVALTKLRVDLWKQ